MLSEVHIASRISEALGKIDGGHALGQIVMQRATQEAVGLARVAAENSTHCGALAYYGLQIERANMIDFVFTHSDSMVVPHAGKHPLCGTNPICLAAPGEGGHTLCLDMATSIVKQNPKSPAPNP